MTLACLPNLEELNTEWEDGDRERGSFLKPLLSRDIELENASGVPQMALRSLQKVTLHYCGTLAGMHLREMLPFLKLPSLSYFSCAWIMDQNEGSNINIADPGSYHNLWSWHSDSLAFPTKGLSLTNSRIDHPTLTKFLRCFATLKYFHYENSASQYYDFEPPRLMEGIEHLKGTLKHLRLFNANIILNTAPLRHYPIGSLVSFRKLESIDIMATMMLGTDDKHGDEFPPKQRLKDSIPPSLESLTLRRIKIDTSKTVFAEILELISRKSIHALALKRLDLEWTYIKCPDGRPSKRDSEHLGFMKEEASKLSDECRIAGVRCSQVFVF